MLSEGRGRLLLSLQTISLIAAYSPYFSVQVGGASMEIELAPQSAYRVRIVQAGNCYYDLFSAYDTSMNLQVRFIEKLQNDFKRLELVGIDKTDLLLSTYI